MVEANWRERERERGKLDQPPLWLHKLHSPQTFQQMTWPFNIFINATKYISSQTLLS